MTAIGNATRSQRDTAYRMASTHRGILFARKNAGSYTGEIPKIAEMTEFELRLAHKHRKKK